MSVPSQTSYRTIVVGAGPAGVMAAREASRAGDVLLVDASRFPRRKSCGGMLNRQTLSLLADIEPVPSELCVEPDPVRFRYLDWVRGRVKPTTLEFANAEREDFDAWLLSLATDSVEVLGGCPITGIETEGCRVMVTLGNGGGSVRVEAEHVIGCDGARSFVRRHIGRGTTDVYVTVQDRTRLDGEALAWFDCIALPGIGEGHAYTYVVPKRDTALIGSVFYPGTRRPAELQDRVVAAIRERRPEIGETVDREGGAALAVRRPTDVVHGSGSLLLSGEAAGFLSPTSGEGISYALRSGHLAGRAVAEGANGDALERYRTSTATLTADIRRRLRWLPLMESRAGRYLAGLTPTSVVDRVTHGL